MTGLPASLDSAAALERASRSRPFEKNKPMTGKETEALGKSPPVRSGGQLSRAEIAKLIEAQYQGLKRLIFRQTGDVNVAADVLNEAVCVTWEKLLEGKLSQPEAAGGYIFQVAVNLLRNRRRVIAERADRRADPELLNSIECAASSPDAAFEAATAAKVREILASMGSARDRQALVRFYLDEEDPQAICRDLGLTGSQFTKVLHRARTRLRALLEAQGLKLSDLVSGLFF